MLNEFFCIFANSVKVLSSIKACDAIKMRNTIIYTCVFIISWCALCISSVKITIYTLCYVLCILHVN